MPKTRSWLTLTGCGFCVVAIAFMWLSAWDIRVGCAFLGLVIIAVTVLMARHVRWKRNQPKDFAYVVYAEWGPELVIARAQRLQEKLPHLPEATISEWLADFEALTTWIGKVADLGGADKMGRANAEHECRKLFPWIGERGLRHAMLLTNYIAWK